MKRKSIATFAISCLTLSSTAFGDGGPGIKWLGGFHGPPDAAGMSPSFPTVLTSRGQQMLEQVAASPYQDKGSGYTLVRLESIDYKKMVVTPSFESWYSELAPGTDQNGNVRYDEGVYVFVNGGTFIPNRVTVRTESFLWNGEGYSKGGPIDITTTLGTVHDARIRMTAGADGIAGTTDDQPATVQDGSLASTGFLFIGNAVALTPFGSGGNAQKMQNTWEWMQSNRFALKHTVTVPTTAGTEVFTKFNTTDPKPDIADFRIVKDEVGMRLEWTSNGGITLVQESHGLSAWGNLNVVWQPAGETVTFPVDPEEGDPRHFWRVTTL